MADYPGSIHPAYTQYKNKDIPAGELGDDVPAPDFNSHGNELVAIETELGTNPRGSKSDVKTRLDDVDTSISSLPVIQCYVSYTIGPVSQIGADIDYVVKTIPDIHSWDLLHVFVGVSLKKTSAGMDDYYVEWTFWDTSDWSAGGMMRSLSLSSVNQLSFLFFNHITVVTAGWDGRIRLQLESKSGNWDYSLAIMRILLYRNCPIAGL